MKALFGFSLACVLCLTASARAADNVAELIQQLKSKDPDMRRDAAEALGKLGPQAAEAVPALIVALKDKNVFVRRHAALALAQIGPEAKSAMPALVQALNDPRREVALAAVAALGKFGADAVQPLTIAFKDKGNDNRIRIKAAEYLAAIGPEAKSAAPALAAELKDEALQEEAGVALARIGPDAVGALTAAFSDKKGNDSRGRRKAAEILGGFGPAAKSAVPALTLGLKDKEVRTEAAMALGKIGPEAKSAVPALTAAAEDKNPKDLDQRFRTTAAEAAKKIQGAK